MRFVCCALLLLLLLPLGIFRCDVYIYLFLLQKYPFFPFNKPFNTRNTSYIWFHCSCCRRWISTLHTHVPNIPFTAILVRTVLSFDFWIGRVCVLMKTATNVCSTTFHLWNLLNLGVESNMRHNIFVARFSCRGKHYFRSFFSSAVYYTCAHT